MVSSVGEVSTVVESMRLGAFWYVSKKNAPSEMNELIKKAHAFATLQIQNRELRQSLGGYSRSEGFQGISAESLKVLDRAKRAAELDSTLLITGESGTGKSTLAGYIHEMSPRKNSPFVFVSCASMPRDLLEAELFGHEKGAFTGALTARIGRIEAAEGGTLFLDEIGDLPLELQPKLLVFLQERIFQRLGSNRVQRVDVRIIAATNQPLQKMCNEKNFREDLFYRLNVLNIDILPLRKRTEDILPYARSYAEKISKRHSRVIRLSESAEQALVNYHWPGNIRELQNVLERAVAFAKSDEIDKADLFDGTDDLTDTTSRAFAGTTLEEVEKKAIIDTLNFCSGNKARAAKILGVSEKTIYNKLQKLGLL
jgi:DNA-binding NtrC family response regulator